MDAFMEQVLSVVDWHPGGHRAKPDESEDVPEAPCDVAVLLEHHDRGYQAAAPRGDVRVVVDEHLQRRAESLLDRGPFPLGSG